MRANVIAVVLFLLGMTLGLLIGAQLLLPLLYGLPVAVAQVARGNLRPMAVPMQLLTPVIWCVILASVVFLGKLIAPGSTAALLKSGPFTAGWLVGAALLLRGLLSTRTRADMWDDFRASTVSRFATERGHAEAQGADTERIISKQEVDQLFALTKSQWNERAIRIGEHGRILVAQPSGNTLGSFDPKTGMGLSVQPLFSDEARLPDVLIVGSYYPAGTLPPGPVEELKKKFESQMRADLGTSYSISVVVTKGSPPDSVFDVVEILISSAGHAALVEKMLEEVAPKERP